MKKQIAVAFIIACLGATAFSQGAILGLNNTTQYVTDTDVLYTGGLTLEVLFSSSASLTQITAINALYETGGGLQLALTDGFNLVSLTGGPTSSPGAVSGFADADSHFSGFPSTIYLSSAYGPNTPGGLVFFFTSSSGPDYGDSGAEAIMGNYGSQVFPFSVTAAIDSLGDNQNLNLVFIPEPGTLAFAAVGGASLLLFRRKKGSI
jgi:hypothetical protein